MKKLFLATALLIYAHALLAQTAPVQYTVSFPNAVHHEAEITMALTQVPQKPLHVRMSRSSPGRYATHEFGKNIYNVTATDGKGNALQLKQLSGDVYEIAAPPAALRISYTLFGNWVDGTYAGIDAGQAHLNMPASFIWAEGFDKRPVSITFNIPANSNWKVSTQLKHTSGNTYTAPNLQYMMDSPTELSDYNAVSWTVANPDGKKQTINLHVYSDDKQPVIDAFAQMVKKLVLEEQAVYG